MAADFCQRLKFHRMSEGEDPLQLSQATMERQDLFWTVYKIERGLTLRLARPSNIRDSEISIPYPQEGPHAWHIGLAKLQGRIYDDLYSPVAMALPASDLEPAVTTIAGELRGLITKTKSCVSVSVRIPLVRI
jgi:hypothetical protein